jgi:hypothetical protein
MHVEIGYEKGLPQFRLRLGNFIVHLQLEAGSDRSGCQVSNLDFVKGGLNDPVAVAWVILE